METWHLEELLMFAIGGIAGSFIGCLIDDPERALSYSGRSKCNYCKQKLTTIALIPILSFFILRGKSICCKKKLSYRYPVYELSLAVLLPIFWYLSTYTHSWIKLLDCIIICFFMYIAFIDWDKMIIPLIPLVVIILLQALVMHMEGLITTHLTSHILAMVMGGGILFFTDKIYILLRKRKGIGDGDPLLFGTIGFYSGLELLFFILALGSVLGSLYGLYGIRKNKLSLKSALPFGTFLILGTIITKLVY